MESFKAFLNDNTENFKGGDIPHELSRKTLYFILHADCVLQIIYDKDDSQTFVFDQRFWCETTQLMYVTARVKLSAYKTPVEKVSTSNGRF